MTKQSVTSHMQWEWLVSCLTAFGNLLPVTHLGLNLLGYEVEDGEPPLLDKCGNAFRSCSIDYDLQELKHEHYLD